MVIHGYDEEASEGMLPGHLWKTEMDLFTTRYQCTCGFLPQNKSDLETHGRESIEDQVDRVEQAVQFSYYVAQISTDTRLDVSTVIDLLSKGWTYQLDIHEPTKWIAPQPKE